MLLFVVGALSQPVETYPDIDFSMSAREIITRAFWDRKVVAVGRQPKAAEMDYGLTALNLLFKTWASKGLTLWNDVDGTATIEAGNATVTLNPRPIDVYDVSLAVSPTYERPMTRWEKGDYATLPNKLQVGEPLMYSPVYTATGVTLKVWPVPTTSRTITYSYNRVIADVNELSDPVDVPQMWIEAVVRILATRLYPFATDPVHLAKIEADAAMLERQMFDHDRPASYFMGADFYA